MDVFAEAVIADARRRQRNRRLAVAGLVALAVAGSLAGYRWSEGGGGPATRAAARRPSARAAVLQTKGVTTVETVVVWAESASAKAPPFRETPAVMRRPRQVSDAVPRAYRTARGSKETPKVRRTVGSLVYGESRAVTAEADTDYLVPTTLGRICVVGDGWEGFWCLRGFDRTGVAWVGRNYGNTTMRFLGVASSSVSRIELVTDAGRVRAHLAGAYFWLDWNIDLTGPDPFLNLNPRLVVRYSDGRPPASESLRSP